MLLSISHKCIQIIAKFSLALQTKFTQNISIGGNKQCIGIRIAYL